MKQFIHEVFDRDLLVHLAQVGLIMAGIIILSAGLAFLESKGW